MITGYRYGKDKEKRIWVIKLSTTKEDPAREPLPGHENEFVSADCICESITEIETGQETKSKVLYGVRGTPIEYNVGQKIEGGLCWYCHTKEDLYKNYLRFSKGKKNGKTYVPFVLADKMDYVITEVYGRTYEELAAEMNTEPAKLREDVRRLKDGLGDREDEAIYMPMLIALNRMGKGKR